MTTRDEQAAHPTSEQYQPEKRIETAGERWQARISQMVEQRFPGRQWLRFAATVAQRRQSPRQQLQHTAEQASPVDQPTLNDDGPVWPATQRDVRQMSDTLRQPRVGLEGGIWPPAAVTPARVPPDFEDDDQVHARGWQPSGGNVSDRLSAGNRPVQLGPQDLPVPRQEISSTESGAFGGEFLPSTAQRLPASVAKRLSFPVTPRVNHYLKQVLAVRIPAVRLYVNQAADEIVRSFGADAVSFGNDILFRTDRYDPEHAAGLGLLAHEITHAAIQDHHAAGGTKSTVVREEELALQTEKQVRQTAHIVAPTALTPLPTPPAQPTLSSSSSVSMAQPNARTPNGVGTAAPVAAAPRAALTDRNIGVAPPMATGGTGQISDQELNRIKEEVYRYLMAQITTEFERGA